MNTSLKSLAILCLAVLTISSCKKKSSDDDGPKTKADFIATYTGSHFAPAQINFNNTSINATSYSWEFGDGGTSTATSQSYTYNDPGDYTVTLTANGPSGASTATAVIHVLNATSARITRIDVEDYPTIDGMGNPWDSTSGPDIYFKLYKGSSSNVVGNYDTTVFGNITPGDLPLFFDLGNNDYTIADTNFTTTYYIGIFDEDSVSTDPLIGILTGFRLSDVTTTHPNSFQATQNNNMFTVHVTWQ
jgi:PKD repeat protein